MRIGLAAAAALALIYACTACDGKPEAGALRDPALVQTERTFAIEAPKGDTPEALEQALALAAKKHASGWEPTGPAIHGDLRQGTRSDHLLVLRGAHCYRVFAIGTDGISDLDLLLFDPNGVQVQQDPAQDRFPTLGMQTEICPTVGGAYRLQAVMFKGSGAFVVRAFEITA